MLIPNEQKEKWNQNSWHEFEVLMYCDLLKYSWITNPSNWIVLIITGYGFLTLNYVKNTDYTKRFGVDSAPLQGVWLNKPLFSKLTASISSSTKKTTWECSQQDTQCYSHHRLGFCSSQAWESPPATVTGEKIQPWAKQLSQFFLHGLKKP